MTTRYGFTSVFDIGSAGDNTRSIRGRIESGEVRGPRIRTTGEVIVAPGAIPAPTVLRALGSMVSANHEVTNADEAAALKIAGITDSPLRKTGRILLLVAKCHHRIRGGCTPRGQ